MDGVDLNCREKKIFSLEIKYQKLITYILKITDSKH